MEYLNPIKQLEHLIKRYQIALVVLALLLGIAIIAVPALSRSGYCIVVEQDGLATLAATKPWKVSAARVEGFLKSYLSARFEWTPETFSKSKETLKVFTSDAVYSKLKDSLASFESIAQNQQAKSHFILEGFGFANAKRRIEARVTRVLRIKHLGLSTPLVIRIAYEDVAVSQTNPYGLVVTGVEEVEAKEGDNSKENTDQ